MEGKAANLVLEIANLETSVVCVCCGAFVKLKAESFKICARSVGVVCADGNVTVSAAEGSVHNLKELFISTRQLDRIVIKRYGKSLHQLIVDRRFTLAEQLLSTTDLTVEVIASRAGFSSSASLYREFKKRRGVTPAAFRRI